MSGVPTECVDPKWEQGAIGDLSKLAPDQVKPPFEAGTLAIVISQSCDVVHDSFEEEPGVEVLFARPVAGVDGNLTDGKNPRVFDFTLKQGSTEQAYRCFMRERSQRDRKLLLGNVPVGQLNPELVYALKRWVGKRYTRAALPTNFNERARPAISAIKALLKPSGEITGVYLSLSSDDELPSGTPYKIILITTVLPTTAKDAAALDRAISTTSKISKALNSCNGLEVMEAEVKSETEVTLYDLRDMNQWDYDYLSIRSGGPLPSEPT